MKGWVVAGKKRSEDSRLDCMEARAGIEPAYTDLQSAASPLRHRATALGIQAVEHHRRKARFFSTVDLVNMLEQEKAMNKAGQLAERPLRGKPTSNRVTSR